MGSGEPRQGRHADWEVLAKFVGTVQTSGAETVGLFRCLADGVVTTADPLDYDLGGRWTLADVQPVTMTG